MPEYSVIIGCLVLAGMETQGRLLSVSGTHAGTGTDETHGRLRRPSLCGIWKARQVISGQVKPAEPPKRQERSHSGRHRPTSICW